MKFTTNNLNKTTCIKGIVLPQDIWLYGGHYCIEEQNGECFYLLKETNKQAFEKVKKDFGNFAIDSFENMNYREILDLKEFVDYLFSSNDKAFIIQYVKYLTKEQNKKFDCYKKCFDNNSKLQEIENKFKNLPYIRPYYETFKKYIIKDYIKLGKFSKEITYERH